MRTAKADLEKTSREFEGDWVESGGGYGSCKMERGSESDC